VARLVWSAVCAALLPVPLGDAAGVVDRFVQHLARTNERDTRERQLDIMRAQCAHRSAEASAVVG
jgi:heme exporter protein D